MVVFGNSYARPGSCLPIWEMLDSAYSHRLGALSDYTVLLRRRSQHRRGHTPCLGNTMATDSMELETGVMTVVNKYKWRQRVW